MEILWKGTVSAKFRAIRSKLCGNCAFPQNFHTRKLGEIMVFYAVYINITYALLSTEDLVWDVRLISWEYLNSARTFDKFDESDKNT